MKFIKTTEKLPFEQEEVLLVSKSPNGDFFDYELGYMYLNQNIPNYVKRSTNFNIETSGWKVVGWYQLPSTSLILKNLI